MRGILILLISYTQLTYGDCQRSLASFLPELPGFFKEFTKNKNDKTSSKKPSKTTYSYTYIDFSADLLPELKQTTITCYKNDKFTSIKSDSPTSTLKILQEVEEPRNRRVGTHQFTKFLPNEQEYYTNGLNICSGIGISTRGSDGHESLYLGHSYPDHHTVANIEKFASDFKQRNEKIENAVILLTHDDSGKQDKWGNKIELKTAINPTPHRSICHLLELELEGKLKNLLIVKLWKKTNEPSEHFYMHKDGNKISYRIFSKDYNHQTNESKVIKSMTLTYDAKKSEYSVK